MNEPQNQMRSLALAAEQQAMEQHRLTISLADCASLAVVDQILDCERAAGDPAWIEPLSLCYGAWWGSYILHHHGGRWVGLHEPVPPRILLEGVVYSPLDAVRRRLVNAAKPRLQTLDAALSKSCDLLHKHAEFDDRLANRTAWDSKANDPRFTDNNQLPSSREEALVAIDPWLRCEGPLESCRLLCLAAGGGTHGPLHAIAGARVTVVDFSAQQLQRDRRIAERFGLPMQLICASMHDLAVLDDATFDAILHPVSLCYVRDIQPVYAEVSRLLRPGGVYVSQQKLPTSLQVSCESLANKYALEHPADEGYRLLASPAAFCTAMNGNRESETTEYIHSLDSLLGLLCGSGFQIEAFQEPPRGDAWADFGSPEHRASFVPPYLKIKARRAV